MKILITGSSQGIGKAIAELFLNNGHEVIGLDRQDSTIIHDNYTHITQDIRDVLNRPMTPEDAIKALTKMIKDKSFGANSEITRIILK